MAVLMRICAACDDYTLQDVCPHCGGKAVPNQPPKFSPEDRYGEYRRRLKDEHRAKAPAASS